jgi:ABC-type multidrug transport system fused ATPase/permease subunit
LPKHRTGLSRLAAYLPGQRLRVTGLAVVGIGMAITQVGPLLIVRDAIDNGMTKRNGTRLWEDVLFFLGLSALGWVFQTTLVRGLARVGQNLVYGLRTDLFDHLTGLSLRYFSEQKAGWIIARLTSDADALSDVLSQGLTTLVTSVLMLMAAIIGVFVVDWRLGLAGCVVLPPALIFVRWFQLKSHAAFLRVRETIAIMTAQVAESISGMAIVQAFNRERAFQAEFDASNDANRESNTYAQYLNCLFFPGIEILGVIAMLSVLWVGGNLVAHHSMTYGTLVTAVFLLNLLFQPLQSLSDLYSQVQSAAAAMEKIAGILDTEADIGNAPDAQQIAIDGHLKVDKVTFSYGREPVLHAIELEVAAGNCLALVGESGGGKSTTAKLVGRFYDPEAGAVLVDGHDLRTLDLRAYRRQLGVVLQDPFLFSGTLADNIRFAKPEATDAQIADVAAAVGVDRVARRFEKGLLHEVREGGSGLSAGERQLISIARALLADPRILILDEATSNIDRPTEILIERALDRLLRGRTSIIIAHRLATVRRANEILVLEHGRITQRGSFTELLAAEGPFRRLAENLEGQGEQERLHAAPVMGRRESRSESVASSEPE